RGRGGIRFDGRRPALGSGRLEVALEVALANRGRELFALACGRRPVRLLQDDVGCDADGLDRAPGRRVVERRREPQTRAVLERVDGLDRALAEGRRAEHERALL